MNRREFLASAGAVALAGPSFGQSHSRPNTRRRPNILLLFADQFRFDGLGCMGNGQVATPHLDQLAASGVRFTQAVTPTPVCVSARMSLITGQRAARTHWTSNSPLPGFWPRLPTLMDLLDQAGYRTHAVGKMHFHGLHYGFHHIESMEEAVVHRSDDDYLMYLKAHGVRTRYPQGLRDLLYYQPQTCGIPAAYSESAWVTDRSVDFMRNHVRYRGDQPFFLWSSWIAPHPPFAPCSPYDSMYEPAKMPLPVFRHRPLASLPATTWRLRGRLDGAHLDLDRIRRIRALYYGQISQVDEGVGRILTELDRLGLADRTVVVFASDHGAMLGDHGLSAKMTPYEFSLRVPLLLRWPGRTEKGRVADDLASTLDLLPTIVTELDLRFPHSAHAPVGHNLLSMDGGGLGPARDAMFVDYGQGKERWVGIRTRQYKYALWASGGREELYDLEKDPEERHNLAESHSGLKEQLRSRVLDWEHRSGLPQSFQGGRFRVYPEPPLPAAMPRTVVINEGRWPDNLPKDEQATVESYAEAFTRAISKETSLAPEKLSIGIYKRKGGHPLIGTPWETAWRRA